MGKYIFQRNFYTCTRLKQTKTSQNISQPYRPPRPVTGIALLFLMLNVASYYKYKTYSVA
jgi:hypothetical protein